MPEHVHLLLTPKRADSVPRLMQSLSRLFVPYINKRYDRTGTLWEGRYKACLVDPENYLLACYRYIELNPVRSSMIVSPAEYPWSSYRWHAFGHSNPLIKDHPLFLALGRTEKERRRAYHHLIRQPLPEGLTAQISTALNQSRILGSAPFTSELERALGQRVRPGKRGRPRKSPPGRMLPPHEAQNGRAMTQEGEAKLPPAPPDHLEDAG